MREFRQDGERFAISLTRDITERKRAESLLAGEKRILEMVAKGEQLAQILESLCRLDEEQASGVLASILLLDGDRLRHGGAPSLPKAYTDVMDGTMIGPSVGSCGTAAYRGEQVIVEDIATDPYGRTTGRPLCLIPYAPVGQRRSSPLKPKSSGHSRCIIPSRAPEPARSRNHRADHASGGNCH